MNNKGLFPALIITVISQGAFAQKSSWRDSSKIEIPELKHTFNASGSHYVKVTALTQVWARHSELNPGSAIDGFAKTSFSDVGIRRWRIQAFGQLTDRLFFYTQFGQNNFSFLSPRQTGAFLHDAVTEYKVAPWLHAGAGLTGWSGMSRYSSPAVASILSLDAPLYQQATIGVNDQFVRKLSLYAHGDIGPLNYRAAVSSPMSVANSTVPVPAITETSGFSPEPPKLQTSGYIMWQFFDRESTPVPYMSGTYLGKKKILNVGAGWVNQQSAMWHTDNNGDTIRTAMTLLGVDVFMDLPVNPRGAAITVYAAYNSYRFGTNYLRMGSPMNPANGVSGSGSSMNGAGTNYPLTGTGNIVYLQFGYKFRDNLLKDQGTLQSYATVQFSDYQRLSDYAVMYEAGLNWLIHGTHGGKISLGIQNRPVFDSAGNGLLLTRKNMYVLQYQIAI